MECFGRNNIFFKQFNHRNNYFDHDKVILEINYCNCISKAYIDLIFTNWSFVMMTVDINICNYIPEAYIAFGIVPVAY
jgi:hypothetical protein